MTKPIETKSRTITGKILGIWWITWFGIIGGCFLVGVQEYRRELSQGGGSHFSLTLLTVVGLSWVGFYAATSRFKKQWRIVWRRLTIVGSILAAISLVGIYFFIAIAPRVP